MLGRPVAVDWAVPKEVFKGTKEAGPEINQSISHVVVFTILSVVVVYQCSISNIMVTGDIEAVLYSKVNAVFECVEELWLEGFVLENIGSEGFRWLIILLTGGKSRGGERRGNQRGTRGRGRV